VISILSNGMLVSSEAVQFALRLEQRGFRLRAQDGLLHVGGGTLTEAETAQIRRWRFHLLEIAGGEA
jgi:hypothetical protein